METKQLNGKGLIRIARTELDVPHKNRIITFALPLFGPGTYKNVMDQISQEKLSRPTTAQTLSLVNLALQNPDEENCKKIISRFNGNYLWSSTESDDNKDSDDIVVCDNIDGNMPFDRDRLIKRFKDGDKAIRVVPCGFKTGKQSLSDLVKNPYIIAQVGDKDFAEDILVKISKALGKDYGYVFALDKPSQNIKRYSAVGSYWVGGSLGIDGGCDDDTDGGYASGVFSCAEGTDEKNQEKK